MRSKATKWSGLVWCCGLWLALAGRSWGQAGPGGASISGVLEDERGKPVPYLVVSWHRSVILPGDAQAGEGSAVTNEKGEFSFSGLGPATYLLCNRSDAARNLLSNCAWTRTPPAVVLGAGEGVTGYRLRVAEGVRVEIDFQDNKKVMKGPEEAGGTPAVRVGLVTRDGMFHPAAIEGRSPNAHQYVVVAPTNVPVKLQVDATGLKLKDEKDVDLGSATVAAEVMLMAGDSPKKYKFKVDKAVGN